MTTPARTWLTVVAVAAATVLVATGCTGGADSHGDDSHPPIRALGEGFLGSDPSPTPEATVSPERGSWDGVRPPAGYRIVLVAAGSDPAAVTLAASVVKWGKAENVDLTVMTAIGDDSVASRLKAAVALKPDLVVGVGDSLIDVFALLSPQNLHQHFLVVGAELPEPTANVTSVVWPGAAFRGTGLGTSGEQDPASFTAERTYEAVAAGVASVLNGFTGIIIDLPE